jgi:hypothetical protein
VIYLIDKNDRKKNCAQRGGSAAHNLHLTIALADFIKELPKVEL